MPCLILARHGETELNREPDVRIRGWLDVPLDAQGRWKLEVLRG